MIGNTLTPRKRNFVLVNGLYLLLVATLITIGNAKRSAIEQVKGDEPIYTITLDADNAPESLGDVTFGSATQTQHYVDFTYDLAKRVGSYHVILDDGGAIYNDANTRITSIKSITATFTGGEATLSVGWQAMPSSNSQSLVSTTTVSLTDNPYFFSITNTGSGELSLASLVITYSCVPTDYIPGENIEYGFYPQSLVTDSNLIETLNTTAGTLPVEYDYQYWTEYIYYFPNYLDEPCAMWYIDLYHQSIVYRGVYFTSYRPMYQEFTRTTDYSLQDDNGYYIEQVYWFKFEPISWRILDVKNSKALLMSNLVIDSQNFDYVTPDSQRTSATHDNNYEQSYIRRWLNTQFLYTSFGFLSGDAVVITNVDNSAASTGVSYNQNACSNTNDSVFLLSYVEVTNASYGFASSESRQLRSSDYARSQGVAMYSQDGASNMWLRSPSAGEDYFSQHVTFDGEFFKSTVDDTSVGVAPVIWISI
jgi:hypothetical protein